MMPYDTYRLYQIERTKSPAEIRRADEQAAQVASVLRDEGVYVVPLEGAVRIALSAVHSDDVPRLVTALARAVERGGRRYSGVRGLRETQRETPKRARRASGR